MKYELWDNENFNDMRKEARFNKRVKELTEAVIIVIQEANNRHNEAMLKKDIKIANLEGQLKALS